MIGAVLVAASRARSSSLRLVTLPRFKLIAVRRACSSTNRCLLAKSALVTGCLALWLTEAGLKGS